MFEDIRKDIYGDNDTTLSSADTEPTVQTNSNPQLGIEPGSFDGFIPVEPPEIVNDYGEQEETPSDKSVATDSGTERDRAGQSGTERDRAGRKELVPPDLAVLQNLHSLGFYTATDFYNDDTTVEYWIDNIIQKEAYHQIHGASGGGKTFMVLDMAATIAYPEIDRWCYKPVEHGDVIYFVGEGSKGIKKRLRLWCDKHNANPADVKIMFCDTLFKLDEKNVAGKLIETVKQISPNPALIIFDTLNIYMSGEENSNTDAGKFNFACTQLIKALHCSVLVVHHTGKSEEGKKHSRGASAFHAALDIEFRVENNGNNIITLTQTKNKDNEIEKPLYFNLVPSPIDGLYDKYGQPVTSCTVHLAEKYMEAIAAATEERKAEAKKPKYTADQQFALRTYKESAKEHGRIVIDNQETGHETIWLDGEIWRETFYELKPDNGNDSKKNMETKRRAFNRAKQFMVQKENKNGTTILTIRREGGNEYYCLDLSSDNTEPTYRSEIHSAIKTRVQSDTAAAEPEYGTTDTADKTSTAANTGEASEQLYFTDANKEIV